MNVTSIANGLMEAVQKKNGNIRPENEKSKNFISKQEVRLKEPLMVRK